MRQVHLDGVSATSLSGRKNVPDIARQRIEGAKGARVQIYRKPRKLKTKITMTTKPTM
jgi:hypothetical protein